MVKISVIVPIYNVEDFLGRCLDSITNQSFKDIEIICINDGSVDNSVSILEDYAKKDNRIKILNQKNSGVSAARNNGLREAKGEYISFVDSDDWIDLDFYEKLYNSAKKYDADIAVCGIKRLRSYKWKYHLKIDKEEFTFDKDKKFQLCDVPEKCYVWNKIYKLSELKKHNIKFEEGVYFEDRCFTAQVLLNLKSLVIVPDVYYNYWTNPNSIVKTKSHQKDLDSKYTRKKLLTLLDEHGINYQDRYPKKYKKYGIFGITLFKILEYKSKNKFVLFNIIKFEINKTFMLL